MKINTLVYSIKQGIKNIRRNLMFSLASVGTIIACLFLFGIFLAIVINFKSIVKNVENSVSISVFFDEGISQEKIDSIGTEIKSKSEVLNVNYISPEEALNIYVTDMYEGEKDPSEIFGDDNPLQDSASYEITLKDVSLQADFVKYLEGVNGIRKIVKSDEAANSLVSLNALVGYASIAIVVILLLVSIFLISNTVTIGITVRKEEIAIMKLIGATDFFVRAPFIVEGVIIGLVGAAIPVTILYFMYGMVVDYITTRFSQLNEFIVFVPTSDIFQFLIPASLIVGVGIGFIGSFVTIRKHLRV